MFTEVTSSTFQEIVIDSAVPCIVDFSATWCGPCKALEPLIEEAAKKFAGRVKVVKADLDQNLDLARQYGIRSVPALVAFKNGDPRQQTVGVVPKQKIFDLFQSIA